MTVYLAFPDMRSNLAVLFSAAFAITGGLIPRADAATIAAVQSANGPSVNWRGFIGSDQGDSLGWTFSVTSNNLELNALGVYALGAAGLQTAHAVGLWDNSGQLLTQATVGAGTANTLVGTYRYQSIIPVTLSLGQTYTIGAYYPSVASICGSLCGDSILFNGAQTYAPGIQYIQSEQNTDNLATLSNPRLAGNGGDLEQGLYGPNFLLSDSVATPEPSAIALTLGGLLLLGATDGLKRLQDLRPLRSN